MLKSCDEVNRRGRAMLCVTALIALALAPSSSASEPWARHTIDDSSRGADGVKMADVNGDGLMDAVTGWEQGGVIRVALHPGFARSKQKWPAVTVGKVGQPEDAVFVDLDGDGAIDVVSCCEGETKSMFVHWAPKEKAKYLDPAAWTTEAIPASRGSQWMFCIPLQVDGSRGVDLIAGAKNSDAQIGWWEAPANPRDLSGWQWHPWGDAGWVMSLVAADLDGDGDQDVVASDRKGPQQGCFWLENPGPPTAAAAPWNVHRIGEMVYPAMFLDVVDLDRDGLLDVVALSRDREIHFYRRKSAGSVAWGLTKIGFPPNTGSGKAARVADMDGDGKLDIVVSCAGADGDKSGVIWMSHRQAVTDPVWDAHEISGPEGVKFDLIQLLDLDGDEDLDVLACEERTNLGVFWYENPAKLQNSHSAR